jgi:AcrR family transcriptional regulator
MTPEKNDTATRLIAAAEEIFLDRGIESVSLREIGRKAEAKNVLAVQYWFTDRDGLIRAILDRHSPDIEVRRHTLLDLYENQGREDVRGLAEALVVPLAAKLNEGIPGAAYFRIVSDLLNRTQPALDFSNPEAANSSMIRWRDMLEPLLEPEAVTLHRRFHTLRFVIAELAQRSRAGKTDHRLFVSQLIDVVVGLLTAEVSDETRRLLKSHRKST